MKKKLITMAVALGVATTSVVASDEQLREKARGAGLEAIPYGTQQVTDNPLTREKMSELRAQYE